MTDEKLWDDLVLGLLKHYPNESAGIIEVFNGSFTYAVNTIKCPPIGTTTHHKYFRVNYSYTKSEILHIDWNSVEQIQPY